jgi:hypothetical protein
MARQHIATILGIPSLEPAPTPKRRAHDRNARPRVLVYVEDGVVDVITEGDVRLDLDAVDELRDAMVRAHHAGTRDLAARFAG